MRYTGRELLTGGICRQINMKIIISPAKTLNLKNSVSTDWTLNNYTKQIVGILKLLSRSELKKALKISDSLLNTNALYIKNFDKKVTYKALDMYNGMVFKALNAASLDKQSLKYLDDNLLILSALYGVLQPSDLIKPYRLDFNSSLKVDGVPLKNYWKKYYNTRIKEGETVFNFASKEFSDLFDRGRYNWHNFDFFELDNDKVKHHSTISKKGRGRLLRDCALHKVKNINEIKKLDGYTEYFNIL